MVQFLVKYLKSLKNRNQILKIGKKVTKLTTKSPQQFDMNELECNSTNIIEIAEEVTEDFKAIETEHKVENMTKLFGK